MKLDHIGFITQDIKLFEKFWVDILGFKNVWESELSVELCEVLFGISTKAICRKYEKDGMRFEIHYVDNVHRQLTPFFRLGINHVCFEVENRKKWLEEHPKIPDVRIYHNPKGWDNIFLKDYEGNWIELRENLKKGGIK